MGPNYLKYFMTGHIFSSMIRGIWGWLGAAQSHILVVTSQCKSPQHRAGWTNLGDLVPTLRGILRESLKIIILYNKICLISKLSNAYLRCTQAFHKRNRGRKGCALCYYSSIDSGTKLFLLCVCLNDGGGMAVFRDITRGQVESHICTWSPLSTGQWYQPTIQMEWGEHKLWKAFLSALPRVNIKYCSLIAPHIFSHCPASPVTTMKILSASWLSSAACSMASNISAISKLQTQCGH